MQVNSMYYNYYNKEGRYTPNSPQTPAWKKIYEQSENKIKSSNENQDSDTYKGLVKLENYYYELGVLNRAKYSTYEELQNALSQKYLSKNSIYANYSYQERRAMYDNELNMSAFGTATNLSDPILSAVKGESDEERQNFNRQSVTNQINNILSKNGIDINSLSLVFSIDKDYNLSVFNLEDSALALKISSLLNENNNAKEFFTHILQSLRFNGVNIDEDILNKFHLHRELVNITGFSLDDFHQENGQILNENGQNIIDIFNEYLETTDKVPNEFKGVAFSYFKSLVDSLANKDLNQIADLNLSIAYENGVLKDLDNEEILNKNISILT
ncbi:MULTISPECIES: DUF4885 family protein [unclassified Campylobacter]|uniref:DUF4885 family protein n=1 Tax=unclassified Campylobacter TaxID=2593542 RepID=UPI001237E61A|nr:MULTISPECIES: DUF4885 family protein [unclassified Campylobacter]KAA6225008.1 DUF4885 domain-containing protein [Campylobacter sp. LR196d]KAA6225329.1 DUF4885 domain-containing protein [Campylobacter sp. LR286c]KAA6230453.1 DUF4885 domain-containing protein [Campylobacter sp. LR291e]